MQIDAVYPGLYIAGRVSDTNKDTTNRRKRISRRANNKKDTDLNKNVPSFNVTPLSQAGRRMKHRPNPTTPSLPTQQLLHSSGEDGEGRSTMDRKGQFQDIAINGPVDECDRQDVAAQGPVPSRSHVNAAQHNHNVRQLFCGIICYTRH